MFSRPEVALGAQESFGDRDAGIVTWQTPIERQRSLGYKQM